ncbi:transposase [Gluconobacter sp. OJB]
MDETIGATDAEWALIDPLLPSEMGRGCRPAGDNRQFFDGMMWMARTGAQWRNWLADMIDSPVVRAHHCAAGIKKMLTRPRRLADHGEGSQPNSIPTATYAASRLPSS